MVAGLTSLLTKGIRQAIPRIPTRVAEATRHTNISQLKKDTKGNWVTTKDNKIAEEETVQQHIESVTNNIKNKKAVDLTEADAEQWQEIYKTSSTDPLRYKELEGEQLIDLQKLVNRRLDPNDPLTQEEYIDLLNNAVKEDGTPRYKPVSAYTKEDYQQLIANYRIPTKKEIPVSLRKNQRSHIKEGKAGVLYDTMGIEDGEIVDSRLDITAYQRFNKWIATLIKGSGKNKKTVYGQTAHLKNVVFKPTTPSAQKVATGELKTGGKEAGKPYEKTPFATIKGNWQNHDPAKMIEDVEDLIDNPEWVQVGYDPRRHGTFYTREIFTQIDELTGQPITIAKETPIEEAAEVIQVGPLVLAKLPKFGNIEDVPYKRGGSIVERNPHTYNMRAI